ncbi:MAG: hypothetical protein QF570_14140 [Myxococcota bacterium]|nr:hypothetical protein [Myxococcota bacterium]
MCLDVRVLRAGAALLGGGGVRQVPARKRAGNPPTATPSTPLQAARARGSKAVRSAEGCEVKLSVRASKDARIYVIGITDDGATVLLPNSFH